MREAYKWDEAFESGGQESISRLRFRRLLHELQDNRNGTCFRYRLIGKMWSANFSRVISVTENTLNLYDESSQGFLTVPDFGDIIQFEIDQKHIDFQPHNHYYVDLEDSEMSL
jgi:hypothetical protein